MFWHMRLVAIDQTKPGKQAWQYYFTHEPPTDPGTRNLRATHTAEIPYVFNNLKAPRVYPDASSPELASASAKEREFAEVVSSYWVNFARTGDPNAKGLAPWPAFRDAAAGRAMILGPQAEPPSAAKLALYDKLYARQMATLSGTQ
jgi:para-nitrobenzyl esterase